MPKKIAYATDLGTHFALTRMVFEHSFSAVLSELGAVADGLVDDMEVASATSIDLRELAKLLRAFSQDLAVNPNLAPGLIQTTAHLSAPI